MTILALLIFVFLGHPIIFKQERPGMNEKIFKVYKFRTMRLSLSEIGNDKERLTKFGRILRLLSLDELPQLYNIIKGDMSFIGPRPLLVRYLPLYNGTQRRRHLVRPGLTGLAQINGRNELSWPDRFVLDINYVDNLSFKLDIQILLKTIIILIRRVGITSKTSATMEEFKENKK
jgi:lipopolysaccharide/colanic/teichoic acid biosynthesis glycosyltransferase